MQIKSSKKTPLLELLSEMAPGSSKNTLRSWIKKGRICIDDIEAKKANQIVHSGQEVFIGAKPKFLFLGLKIVYEDDDLVVVNKPAGLLSVPTNVENEPSAHRILKRQYHRRKVFPIHRLDKETSGLLVFAYNEKAKDSLKDQLAKRTMHREYRAVVEGHPGTGTWNDFLRENNQMRVFVVSADKGKEATTHFETLKKIGSRSLLKLRLQTGRKHQIRVQASNAGYPIIGDTKYGRPGKHLHLQAVKLSFLHPTSQKKICLEVQPLWD